MPKAKFDLQDDTERYDRGKITHRAGRSRKQALYMVDNNHRDLWEIWAKCAKKYGIPNLTNWGNIRPTAYSLQTIGICSPSELALSPKGRLDDMMSNRPSIERVHILWKEAK